MRKYEINFQAVTFIERAVAYTFELPRSDEEKEFMKKNEALVNKYVKRYPRINYDPLGAYQYACSLFSDYTAQEKDWIWTTNSDMAIDNANINWALLKKANEEAVGVYFFKHFFYRIKIFFQQVKFFISTRTSLLFHTIGDKLGIKDKKRPEGNDDLIY